MSAERLRRAIEVRRREWSNEVQVSDAQVALVCRAFADHTLLMQALKFDVSDGPWPEATSLGRFFHYMADEFKDLA